MMLESDLDQAESESLPQKLHSILIRPLADFCLELWLAVYRLVRKRSYMKAETDDLFEVALDIVLDGISSCSYAGLNKFLLEPYSCIYCTRYYDTQQYL